MAGEPIEGQVLLLAAAKSAVSPTRLPDLVDVVRATLESRRERYRREYERFYAGEDLEAYLVEEGHWTALATSLELSERELSAVRRAHDEQLRRVARREDRADELEAALEIREPLCLGPDAA